MPKRIIIKNLLICTFFNIFSPIIGMQQATSSGMYKSGLSYRQGKKARKNIDEDRYASMAILNNNPNQAFFGVFDGHEGKEAAEIASKKLPGYFIENLKNNSAKDALNKAFSQTDHDILSSTKSGTTASTVYFDGSSMLLGWVGDSQIMIIYPDGTFKITPEHKPREKTEKERLMQSHPDNQNDWEKLNLTRSLGDKETKERIPGVMIAVPDLEQLPLVDNSIIIVASDGLWALTPWVKNEIVYKTVSNFTKELMAKSIQELQEKFPIGRKGEISQEAGDEKLMLVARALADTAYNRFSPDNIEVMVIHVKQPTEQAILKQAQSNRKNHSKVKKV